MDGQAACSVYGIVVSTTERSRSGYRSEGIGDV
jgi:hypothetical protein